jgi:hypothetical protein
MFVNTARDRGEGAALLDRGAALRNVAQTQA